MIKHKACTRKTGKAVSIVSLHVKEARVAIVRLCASLWSRPCEGSEAVRVLVHTCEVKSGRQWSVTRAPSVRVV